MSIPCEMSPATISEKPQQDLHLDQLQAVGKAFDALLLTLYRLTHRHNELKQYTEELFNQVNTRCPSLPPPSPSQSQRLK